MKVLCTSRVPKHAQLVTTVQAPTPPTIWCLVKKELTILDQAVIRFVSVFDFKTVLLFVFLQVCLFVSCFSVILRGCFEIN